MDFGQRFTVHFPGQDDLVGLHLGPRDANKIVAHLKILDVGLSTVKLEMFSWLDETPAVFNQLLQADTDVTSCPNGTLSPRCLGNLVSLTTVQGNLLNTTSSRALDSDRLLHAWELSLIHEIMKFISLWVIHQPI